MVEKLVGLRLYVPFNSYGQDGQLTLPHFFLGKLEFIYIQSNLGYPNADYPKLLGYSKAMDSPDFFLYYLLK